MPDISVELVREGNKIWTRHKGDAASAMRAVLEFAFARQEPVPGAEVTDAAVEALAREFYTIIWRLTPDPVCAWENTAPETHRICRKLARHVLSSRQPKLEDIERIGNLLRSTKRKWMLDKDEIGSMNDFCASAILALYDAPARIATSQSKPSDRQSFKLDKWIARGTQKLHEDLDIATVRIAELEAELAALKQHEQPKWMFYHDGVYEESTEEEVRHFTKSLGPYSDEKGMAFALMQQMWAEIDRLRVQSPAIRLGEGLTEAQEGWTATQRMVFANRFTVAANELNACPLADTAEGLVLWFSVRDRLQSIATALRASATPKAEAFPPEDCAHVAYLLQSNAASENHGNLRAILSNNLNMIIAALRAKGGV